MGNNTIFWMFENPRRGRQARNFFNKCSENSRRTDSNWSEKVDETLIKIYLVVTSSATTNIVQGQSMDKQ